MRLQVLSEYTSIIILNLLFLRVQSHLIRFASTIVTHCSTYSLSYTKQPLLCTLKQVYWWTSERSLTVFENGKRSETRDHQWILPVEQLLSSFLRIIIIHGNACRIFVLQRTSVLSQYLKDGLSLGISNMASDAFAMMCSTIDDWIYVQGIAVFRWYQVKTILHSERMRFLRLLKPVIRNSG